MDPVTSLALGRVAVGAAAYLAPGAACRLLLPGPPTRGSQLLMRLFGIRDLALGVLALTTTGDARRGVTRVSMAVDASDAVSSALAARGGGMGRAVAAGIAASALGAAATGGVALRRRAA